jgi:hypothetical protein
MLMDVAFQFFHGRGKLPRRFLRQRSYIAGGPLRIHQESRREMLAAEAGEGVPFQWRCTLLQAEH